jgi:hypothetical protein
VQQQAALQLAQQQHALQQHAARRRQAGGAKHTKVLLSRWLQRPGRQVDARESLWVFCEMLLLMEQAAASSPDACLGCVRPSRLMLTADGRILLLPAGEQLPGAELALADASEEELYRSPEEAAAAAIAAAAGTAASRAPPGVAAWAQAPPAGSAEGSAGASPTSSSTSSAGAGGQQQARAGSAGGAAALSAQADMFSLGVLFFDLFYAPSPPAGAGMAAATPGATGTPLQQAAAWQQRARLSALQDLRQRILPPAFLRQRPQEAAFVLTLLHPDPALRPTLLELLNGDLLKAHVQGLRARRAAQAASTAPPRQPGQQQAPGAGGAGSGMSASDVEALAFFLRQLQQRKLGEVAAAQATMLALEGQVAVVAARWAAVQAQHAGQQLQHAGPQVQALPAAAAEPRTQQQAGALLLQQQRQQQQQTAAAAQEPAASSSAQDARRRQEEDDDDEMDARESRRRPKRQRTAPQPSGSRISALAPRQLSGAGAAAGGGASGAGGALVAAASAAAAAGGEQLPPLVQARWGKVLSSFPALEVTFRQRQRQWQQQQAQAQQQPGGQQASDLAVQPAAGPSSATAAGADLPAYLETFCDDLAAFTRYSRFTLRAAMRQGDPLGGAHLVCSAGAWGWQARAGGGGGRLSARGCACDASRRQAAACAVGLPCGCPVNPSRPLVLQPLTATTSSSRWRASASASACTSTRAWWRAAWALTTPAW